MAKQPKRQPNKAAAFVKGYMQAHPPRSLAEARTRMREAMAAYRHHKNPAGPVALGIAQGAGVGLGLATVQALTSRRNPVLVNPRFAIGEIVAAPGVEEFGARSGIVVGVEKQGGFLGGPTLYKVQLPNQHLVVMPEKSLKRLKNPRRRRNPNLDHCVECGAFHNPTDSGRKRCPRCLRNYRRRAAR